MSKILAEEGKVILLGNEAIARGALESGVSFASTYPGTPASEIGDTFSSIAKKAGIYFEYSVNEKVALEAAAGAAWSGLRSIVSFKHFGLNVASDSLFPLAFIGINAGFVVVVADDPSCWSSAQSEQDSRLYARISHLPMLEPSNPQECKDFVKIAFELSEEFKLPVLIRLTTRVSHARGIVKLGKIVKGKSEGEFVKNVERYTNLPPHIIKVHESLHRKIEKIKEVSERIKINSIFNNVKSKIGIITSGASFNYVMEALEDLKLKIPVLKLGLTYPLPERKIKNFIRKFKSVLVVEELDDFLEKEVYSLAKESNPKLKIFGKNLLSVAGELNEEAVIGAISKIIGKKFKIKFEKISENYKKIKIPRRFPLLCPGCPHRASFYAAKLASGKETIFGGDIGCYILGVFPPLETSDFIVSMGAVQGITHGIKKSTKQKAIAFIGDSTFFHAGIPGLINMVYNKSNPLVIVLDNRTTAMTGHQPHPGIGITGMQEKTKEVAIEEIAKACGVENVRVVDPFNLSEMVSSIKEFLEMDKVSVIVAKRECQLLATRRKRREGIKIPKFEIDQNKCNKCRICLYEFGCPAFFVENNNFKIDSSLCTGCAVCVQVCPAKAIHVVK